MNSNVSHDVQQDIRPDGSLLLTSNITLGPTAANTGQWLHHWAETTPARVFLAERSGAGWREESYQSILQQVQKVAQSLLARGMSANTPLIVLSGNGVDHGILALAAQYVGIPVVPLAEQYALIPEAHDRLVDAIDMVNPTMAYVSDAVQFASAIGLEAMEGIEVVASVTEGAQRGVTPFTELLKGDDSVDVASVYATVGPETVAKVILTSGSSSKPKGVLTTHGMLCVNQAQISTVMPVLSARPPVILDWLPWNHVFGGSHNFNMMLANGGSLYIDDGKPIKKGFGRMLENLSMAPGTLALNVPIGFSLLLEAFRNDNSLKHKFFSDLDLMFYAGASLPADVWDGLEQMATEVRGSVPMMVSSWGMTETAPASIMVHEDMGRAGVIGVPLPDVRVKLLPLADERFELRVAGPNVMSGYVNDATKTKESFDDEGFLITGDAVKLRDKNDPNAGLIFHGRTSEDFKLMSGTWVRAANLRLSLLGILSGLVQDVVITGQDMPDIGLMIFPLPDALLGAGEDSVLNAPELATDIARRLGEAARTQGSSMRIARAVILAEPPSVQDAEITPKGSLNPRKIITRRAEVFERLYSDDDPAVIRILE
ncbi:MAG: AMP-binding protein [Granulosicoccus sp.]